jgi:hypothetical protein
MLVQPVAQQGVAVPRQHVDQSGAFRFVHELSGKDIK